MRGYIFTDVERGRLRLWLEAGVEDDATRMLFVSIRRSLSVITGDVGLLAEVAGELRRRGRLAGRGRLPRRLDSLLRRGGSESSLRRGGGRTSGGWRG